MLIASFLGAPFAFINMWFRIDYWNPPELFFFHIMSIEDILFAFTTTGISVTIFDALFTERQIKSTKSRNTLTYIFIPTIILSFFFLNNYLGINSMFMWAIPMIFLAIVIVIIRNDLLIPSLISAILSMLIAIPIYILLFNYISPEYWDKYWYLKGTKYEKSIRLAYEIIISLSSLSLNSILDVLFICRLIFLLCINFGFFKKEVNKSSPKSFIAL